MSQYADLERVTDLARLHQLAQEKRSVFGESPIVQRRMPAAVLINMTGHVLYWIFLRGLYVYPLKAERPPWWNRRYSEGFPRKEAEAIAFDPSTYAKETAK